MVKIKNYKELENILRQSNVFIWNLIIEFYCQNKKYFLKLDFDIKNKKEKYKHVKYKYVITFNNKIIKQWRDWNISILRKEIYRTFHNLNFKDNEIKNFHVEELNLSDNWKTITGFQNIFIVFVANFNWRDQIKTILVDEKNILSKEECKELAINYVNQYKKINYLENSKIKFIKMLWWIPRKSPYDFTPNWNEIIYKFI